jgi:hypothetical protein
VKATTVARVLLVPRLLRLVAVVLLPLEVTQSQAQRVRLAAQARQTHTRVLR